MEAKYRVDFYYWNKDTGFSHVETVDNNLDYFINAKEYIEDIENTAEWIGLSGEGYGMPITDYDAIWVKIVDNENDYVMSEYWWENTKKENKIDNDFNEIDKDYDFKFWDCSYKNKEWKIANVFKKGKCIVSCCFDYDNTMTFINTTINGQKYNSETDYIENNTLLFVPYTIKFNHPNWKDELKEAMFKAVELFEK